MRRIYMDATSVVVWLGEGSKNIELALSWAEVYIANESSSPLAGYWRYLESQAERSKKVGRERFIALVNASRGYNDILNLKYWTRMWTFQEFRLPLAEPTCVYGCHILTASTLVGKGWQTLQMLATKLSNRDNLRYLYDSDINSRPIVSIGQEQEVEPISQLVISGLEEALELGRSLFVHPPAGVASLKDSLDWVSSVGLKPLEITEVAETIRLVRTYRPEQEPEFAELLLLTVGRESFDPRDRFYGVYGLAPEIQRKFPANYDKSPEQVCLEATAYLINYRAGLILHEIFGLREHRLSCNSLPSWVPNFNKRAESCIYQHYTYINKSAASLPHGTEGLSYYKLSADLSTLHFWARTLGHCKVIWSFESNVPDIIKQIASTLFYPSITQVSECSDHIRSLARSCVANSIESSKFTTDQILEAYKTAWEALATLGDGDWLAIVTRSEPCVQMVLLRAAELAGKTLFGMSNGHFGIGGTDVEDGDVVMLPLTGGPLLLRRKEKLDESRAKCSMD